jgi:Tfp pilus assembly protein PilO
MAASVTWDQYKSNLLPAAILLYERLTLVGVAGLILMAIAVAQLFFLDLPSWRHERALNAQLAVLRHTLKQLPTEPIRRVADSASESPLPNAAALPGILAGLSRIAVDNHLSFPSAEYTWTAATESSFGQYELQFEMKGGYIPIRHFLEDVQNEEPAIAIRELTFTRDNADQKDLRSKIRLVIFTDGHAT